MLFPYLEWIETDEQMKDSEWANRIVSFLRQYSSPLVNVERAERGMAYLLGVQDMAPTKSLFQEPSKLNLDNKSRPPAGNPLAPFNPPSMKREDIFLQREMVGVDFKSMPVMEKLRNMIIAEIKKMGVVLDVKCDDPTATIKRKEDVAFIKDKENIEGFLNYVYASLGQAPVKMDEYEDRFGEKPGNGNIQEFDEMGFDNKNPSDISFFLKNFHKLRAEMAAESCINAIMKSNQVDDVLFENWTSDFLAKKAITCQLHISKLNGKPIIDYATPETVKIYGGGKRKDFNDATAKAIEQRITVKELLDRVGDSFDFEKETGVLFQAIFAASNGNIDITGIGVDAKTGWFCQDAGGMRYNYDNFMSQKVTFGYIEFISPNDKDYGDDFKKANKDKYDNKSRAEVNNNQPPNGKHYQNKARYEVPTYCTYYLVLSAFEQRMFNFGKVPYNQIEGYNDFDANWTILTYKEIGDSIAANCAPWVDLINEAWYKWRYEIRRAKPRGVAYNYDSLLAIAEETFADTDLKRADKIQKMISWFDGSANIVWKYPEIDGKIVPISNTQLNIDMPNGLTDGIMKWWDVLTLSWDKMLSVVGLDAPLRQGDPGNARDSMNNQFKALEYSQNNTYYIPDGITYMTQMLATRSMLYVQDIINFNDYDTMAFNALVDLVGRDTLEGIAEVGKKALHRYGIFVESLNQGPQRAKLQARLDLAVQNGKITNAEALLIDEIKSPKKQFIVLAYFEQRNNTIQQKNAMELQQAQGKQQLQVLAAQKENIMLQGNLDIEKESTRGQWLVQAHLVTQQGGLAKAEMKHSADSNEIYQQAHANVLEQQQNLNTTGKTTPPAPNLMQTPTGYQQGPPTPQAPPSAMQQNVQASQTAPTGVGM